MMGTGDPNAMRPWYKNISILRGKPAMTFLDRLKGAVKYRGVDDSGRRWVSVRDLRDLIHHFERLEASDRLAYDQKPYAYEFYNPETGHAYVDYTSSLPPDYDYRDPEKSAYTRKPLYTRD